MKESAMAKRQCLFAIFALFALTDDALFAAEAATIDDIKKQLAEKK